MFENLAPCISQFAPLVYHIFNNLSSSEADIFLKDNKGKYLAVNEAFLEYALLDSHDEVIGKTDLDLHWSEWAPIMMKNDREVIYTGKQKRAFEPCRIVDKEIDFFYNDKKPLLSIYKPKKIIGVFGIAIPIKNSENDFLTLSKREIECIFHLMKGKTAKEIAKIIHLSNRTVEKYINNVKIKWNCLSKNQLIEKAHSIFNKFESGFSLI